MLRAPWRLLSSGLGHPILDETFPAWRGRAIPPVARRCPPVAGGVAFPGGAGTRQRGSLAAVTRRQVLQEVPRGRGSRHGLLEEVERHLESSGDQPLEGALEIILEELHNTPEDPHLMRLLALLHERNGDPAGARRMLAMAKGAESGAEQPRPSLGGR